MITPESLERERQMQQVEQFLEWQPHVPVPDDFASRVVSQLPKRPQTLRQLPRLTARAGGRSLRICLAAMLLLAFAAAPMASRGAHTWQTVEWIACLELFVLIPMLAVLRRGLPR